MANTDRISRPSGEHGFAGITGAYNAMCVGRARTAAFLLGRWAALVALGATALFVVVHFIIKYW